METLNTKQQEILKLAQFGKWVKYQIQLNQIAYTSEDLIAILKHISEMENDRGACFIFTTDYKHVNVYNISGFAIYLNINKYEEFKHLPFFDKNNGKDITTYHTAKKELKIRLAQMLRLPIFGNGNLYKKTKLEINKLVA